MTDELRAPLLLCFLPPLSKTKASNRSPPLNICNCCKLHFIHNTILLGEKQIILFKMLKGAVLFLTGKALCNVHWLG